MQLRKITFLALFITFLGQLHAQQFNMSNAPINSCDGFFNDSGGVGLYSNNETFTTTICPVPGSGTHIQLSFSGTEIQAGDILCFHDGNSLAADILSCSDDFGPGTVTNAFIVQATAANPTGCLTVDWMSNSMDVGAGWAADINCIARCQNIFAELTMTDPPVMPVDTGYIDVCPGTRVLFSGRGLYPQNGVAYNHSDFTCTFEWNFGNGNIAYGPNVSQVFDEPGGYFVQLTITDAFGCKNLNYLSQRVRVAPKPDFDLLGNIPSQICANDTISLHSVVNTNPDSMAVFGVLPSDGAFSVGASRSDSLALPDGDGTCYETSILLTQFSPGQTLTNINDLLGICVNMEHSWLRDLEISLECPDGTSVILHNHPGPTGGETFLGVPFENDENLPAPIPGTGFDYCWTPNATNPTWIQYCNMFSPNTLPAGDYSSFQPLSNLLGCPLNGEWKIEVCDRWSIDNGYIFNWGINFQDYLYPDLETFSPALVDWSWQNHPSSIYLTQDTLIAAPFNAGTARFVFQAMDEYGCLWDDAVSIPVLPPTHPDCFTCGTDNPLTLVQDTVVCIGSSVDLNAGISPTNPQTIVFETFPSASIGFANYPPANAYRGILNVNSISPATLVNPTQQIASVCIDMTARFVGDLQFYLRAPSGQTLHLSTNNGGSGENYTQTCFTPTATIAINNALLARPPFTGDWRPEGSFNSLTGATINGDWTLLVSDGNGIQNFGVLNAWSITFNSLNPVNYTWASTAPSTISCTNCPTPSISPTDTTQYFVTINDSYGCTFRDTTNALVLSNIMAPTIICTNDTAGVLLITWSNAVIGLDYEVNVNNTGWQNANQGTQHEVTGLVHNQPVNIQVRAKVPSGQACAVDVATENCLYQNCSLDAFPSPVSRLVLNCPNDCNGFAAISAVNGASPFTYELTNLNTGVMRTQNNGSFTGLCAALYIVKVTDAVGCVDTTTFRVSAPPAIVINTLISTPISCNGGNNGVVTASASGGNMGAYNYLWSDPLAQNNATASNLAANTYIVTVTDVNNCSSTKSVILPQPTAIAIQINDTDVRCRGGSSGSATAIPTGGTGPYTYLWSGGTTPTQATAMGLMAGSYSVTVTDANQCTRIQSVTIDQPSIGVSVTANQIRQACAGAAGNQATALAIGGTGSTYNYAWSSGQNTATVVGLAANTYTVTTTDGQNCTATTTIVLTDLPAVSVNLIFDPPTCAGFADGSVAANIVTGGTGMGYTYRWNTTPAQISDEATGLIGGQSYTVTVTDSQGCTGTKSAALPTVLPVEVTGAKTDVLCFGEPNGTVSVSSIKNATSPYTYAWNIAAGGQTDSIAINLLPGNYTVTVTDANGCTGSFTRTVGSPTILEVNPVVVNNKCYAESLGSIQINPSGGSPQYTYLWSNGQTTANLTTLAAGAYTVTLTDKNDCILIDTLTITEPESILLDFNTKDVSCVGFSNGAVEVVPIGGTPPFQYSINGSDFSGNGQFFNLKPGAYPLFVKDKNGCVFNDVFDIQAADTFSVEVTLGNQYIDEVTIQFGESIQLWAEPINGVETIRYEWIEPYLGTLNQTNSYTTISTPDNTITYIVKAIDANGCVDTDLIKVIVNKPRGVMVPTGFSPEGNVQNKRLLVHGIEGVKITYFKVFDRWGEMVFMGEDFSTNDTTKGWDGTFKGESMMPGIYLWSLEAVYPDGDVEFLKGQTTLLR